MTECTQTNFGFPSCKSRKITADFSGGNITSNGGVLLLKQADSKLGLTRAAARLVPDDRRKSSVKHTIEQMFRQRVYAIGCGEEDLNDHDELRHDIALQTAVGCDQPLASPSTLCRFENRAQRQAAVDMNALLVDQFIASHAVPPKEIILDFDATDDVVHGNQEGRFFHGYYDHYCFLPLYVFCGSQLLCAYLRPSKIDGAKHAWAILALLTKRVRQTWPGVKIMLLLFIFVIGWLTQNLGGSKIDKPVETFLARVIPGYTFVRGLSAQLNGDSDTVPVVLVRQDDGASVGFEMERNDNGWVSVFLPGSSQPWSGSVMVINADRVIPLNMTYPKAIYMFQQMEKGSTAYLPDVNEEIERDGLVQGHPVKSPLNEAPKS